LSSEGGGKGETYRKSRDTTRVSKEKRQWHGRQVWVAVCLEEKLYFGC